jgi:hypothetical protein
MNSKTSLLIIAASNFVKAPRPSTILNGMGDTHAWFTKHEIVYPTMFTRDGNAIGFKKVGADAVIALAEGFLKEHLNYARATDLQRLTAALAEELIAAIQNGAAHEDYCKFEEKLKTWFANETVPKTHYIPCSITPYDSKTFNVGPVTFHTVRSFKSVYEIGLKDELEQYGYNKLFEFAAEQKANWIAEITIEGYDQIRSSEQANIAVDIALTVLQLLIPSSISREVSRSTARTIPPFKGSFEKVGESWRVGHMRCDPCFSYSAEYFDELLFEHRIILDSVGCRVNSFVTNVTTLPKLDQAWCDAAYWFHEGVSEKLDTIAVTKMETSIEVLIFAENPSGCKNSLIKAFQAIYGLDRNQPLSEDNPRTVYEFINSIVRARSRILHGTWSTLNYRQLTRNEHQHRADVEWLARDLLVHFTLQLDEYKNINNPEDDFKKFIEWIAVQKGNLRAPLKIADIFLLQVHEQVG